MKYKTFCNACRAETEHYSKNQSCAACQKRQARDWQIANPAEAKIHKREWAKRNRAHLREYAKVRRQANPEKFREVDRLAAQRRRAKDPIAARARQRQHAYPGVTVTRPEPETCECCGGFAIRALHLDHCHVRNVFRGYLCSACNTGIGLFRDDPARLRQAIDYLARTRVTT